MFEEWRDSFKRFLADVGKRPAGTTLERIDNDKGYQPGNVRWATRKEQSRNRCNNFMVTYQGISAPLIAHCERLNLSPQRIWWRLTHGWGVDKAFATRDRVVLKGEAASWSKLTEKDVRAIRTMYASGKYRFIDIAKIYGVVLTTVHSIVRGTAWRSVL